MSIKIGNNIVAKSSTYHPDLFDVKWSDHILDNISWLRADTFSWHSGELYNKAYEHLLEDYNNGVSKTDEIEGITIWYRETQDGHKITTIINGESEYREEAIARLYEKTGVAWYYIIDTNNHRFKLPRAKHNKYANSLGVVGNGMTLGLTNGSNNEGLYNSNMIGLSSSADGYGNNVNTNINNPTTFDNLKSIGITTDSTKSGIIAQQEQDTDQYKYLYFYVGNFAQNDLQNVAGGIQDKDTAVNYDNITNCITHIPQNIKLELNNETLILKAGSKVYYPDGFESDGTTKKFGILNISEDYIFHTEGDATYLCGLNYYTNPDQWRQPSDRVFSGETEPSSPSENDIWYDIANNIIKRYTNNQWVTYQYSFPIGIITSVNDICTSIDQVFNGFGYIGDEFFVLPGVKCLMPDGRNTNGSLKSIEFTTNKVSVCHDFDRKDPMDLTYYHKSIFLDNNGSLGYANFYWQQKDRPDFPTDPIDRTLNYWYNTETNQIWFHRETIEEIRQRACVGQYLMTSNGITNFEPKQVFSAVDYSDVKTTIFSAFEPDYSNPVTISSSGYKVTRHGWIITTISSTWDSSSNNGKVFVNNVLVASNTHTDGTTGKAHRNTFMFPVWVGNIITYTGNIIDIKLYPLK